jgi:hypothetical protein
VATPVAVDGVLPAESRVFVAPAEKDLACALEASTVTEQQLVERLIRAFEASDVEGIVALLRRGSGGLSCPLCPARTAAGLRRPSVGGGGAATAPEVADDRLGEERERVVGPRAIAERQCWMR